MLSPCLVIFASKYLKVKEKTCLLSKVVLVFLVFGRLFGSEILKGRSGEAKVYRGPKKYSPGFISVEGSKMVVKDFFFLFFCLS